MNQLVLDGSLFLAIPVALLAGLVSFLSPCVLPLVPGYLGFVSGTASAERGRGKTVLGALLFVLGFSVVFVLLGAAFGGFGALVHSTAGQALQIILGFVVLLMGFVLIGQFRWAQFTAKLQWRPSMGLVGAPLLGIVFGLGWTPCIGPTLSSVLLLTLDQASAGRGIVLTIAYSLGLGLPFIAIAAGLSWATKSVGFVKRHIRGFNIAGGALLMALGLLLVTGLWNTVIAQIQEVTGGYTPAL